MGDDLYPYCKVETCFILILFGYPCSQPGFRQMKVLKQGRSTVCFIEFVDTSSAVVVHNSLQGALL
eukprot:c25646_g1_i3 orf=216-413(+)